MTGYDCPMCHHTICMGCYRDSWAHAKSPNIQCCTCHTQNDQRLWHNAKFQEAREAREERFSDDTTRA